MCFDATADGDDDNVLPALRIPDIQKAVFQMNQDEELVTLNVTFAVNIKVSVKTRTIVLIFVR